MTLLNPLSSRYVKQATDNFTIFCDQQELSTDEGYDLMEELHEAFLAAAQARAGDAEQNEAAA